MHKQEDLSTIPYMTMRDCVVLETGIAMKMANQQGNGLSY